MKSNILLVMAVMALPARAAEPMVRRPMSAEDISGWLEKYIGNGAPK